MSKRLPNFLLGTLAIVAGVVVLYRQDLIYPVCSIVLIAWGLLTIFRKS